MAIFPGSSLANSQGRLCKVGPLMFVKEAWYGLVPNHIFKDEKDVFEAGSGLLVGTVVRQAARQRHDGYADIADAFSVVKFLSYAPIQRDKHYRPVACVDPIDILRERLMKRGTMSHKSAKLVSIDGPFLMKSGEEVQHFMGAFGIDPVDDNAVLAEDGDAGSSILAHYGDQLVGVLLGVADGTYYCAPAVDLIATHFRGFESIEIVA